MKIKIILIQFFKCLFPSNDNISGFSDFIIPKLNTCFFIRLSTIILTAYLFFGYICIPAQISGASMEPTYFRVGFNFCWRPSYWFSSPNYGDIVIIRYTNKKLYLKRLIGKPGDTIAIQDGQLIRNGKKVLEAYVKKSSNWNLPERTVQKGKIYVIGDNRSMPIENHKFGAVKIKRLYGAPLW